MLRLIILELVVDLYKLFVEHTIVLNCLAIHRRRMSPQSSSQIDSINGPLDFQNGKKGYGIDFYSDTLAGPVDNSHIRHS
jgi:hypothetical protein